MASAHLTVFACFVCCGAGRYPASSNCQPACLPSRRPGAQRAPTCGLSAPGPARARVSLQGTQRESHVSETLLPTGCSPKPLLKFPAGSPLPAARAPAAGLLVFVVCILCVVPRPLRAKPLCSDPTSLSAAAPSFRGGLRTRPAGLVAPRWGPQPDTLFPPFLLLVLVSPDLL